MGQRELLEFRTPQHPSLGTNNWGGASPLLARNIPKESLDQMYSRLNNVRVCDEIFPANGDYDFQLDSPSAHGTKHEPAPMPRHCRRRFLAKLIFPRKEKVAAELGSNLKKKKKRWFLDWIPIKDGLKAGVNAVWMHDASKRPTVEVCR